MSRYRFDDFTLDAGARILARDGQPVALPAKAFDCLLYLLEHRERAVGRDELIAAVWGKVDVSDGVLGQTILTARRALGDRGQHPRHIRTVLRFGYHWQAPVENWVQSDAAPTVAEAETDAAPHAVEPADAPASSRAPSRRRLVLGLLLAALAALALWRLPHEPPRRPSDAYGATLVLPIETGDADAPAWMRLGLMDLIAARLRSFGQPVVPSDNVVALLGAHSGSGPGAPLPAELAATSGARRIISGRIERRDGRWRIELQSVFGDIEAPSASGESSDALLAAGEASDALARQLGLSPPPGAGAAPQADALASQIEAALLEDRVIQADELLAQAGATAAPTSELRLLQGRVAFKRGQLDRAESIFQQLTREANPELDPLLHGLALSALGGIDLARGERERALRVLDGAIEALLLAGDLDALGKAYANRAAVRALRGEREAELADLAAARAALSKAGDRYALAVMDSNAGSSAMLRGRFDEATTLLADAAARLAPYHAPAAEATALANLAEARMMQLDPAAALEAAQRLHTLTPRVADPERARDAQVTWLAALYANGHLMQADRELAHALTDYQGRAADARIKALAARRALDRGDPSAARQLAAGALEATRDARSRAAAWLSLLRAELALGDPAAAVQLRAAVPVETPAQVTTNENVLALPVALGAAELAAAAGDAEADAAYRRALTLAEQSRVPADLLLVTASQVDYLLRRGRASEAAALSERLAPWSGRDYEAALVRLRVAHAALDPKAWRSALGVARALAGEREIPLELTRHAAAADPSR